MDGSLGLLTTNQITWGMESLIRIHLVCLHYFHVITEIHVKSSLVLTFRVTYNDGQIDCMLDPFDNTSFRLWNVQ
jgi:hypothetical protein